MEHNPNLKLHIEDDDQHLSLENRLDEVLPVARQLANQFTALTGWVLEYQPTEKARKSYAPDSNLPVFGQFETIDLAPEVPAQQTALHRGLCDQLLESLNAIMGRLEAAELALWQHQHYAAKDGNSFLDFQFPSRDSDVLANMLKQASESMHATGAALYLLDDETTQLNLRATIGPVSAARQMQPTRALEHSLADLEALVGNVVTITDSIIGESWKIPEPFQYGVCVMLGEPGMPLGTVWLFFEAPRQPSPQDLRLLNDLSEKIGHEIHARSREKDAAAQSPMEQEIRLTAKLNDCRLPSYPPEVDSWKAAGWTYRQDKLAGVFHEWSVTPSGQLSVAVGQVAGPMLPATINANNLRSLICAHREYRHSARSMVEKLNENVWTNSPGDDLASLIYVLIDPETNVLQAVNAGDGGMVFGNQHTAFSIDQFQNPLGADLDLSFEQWEQSFEESDTLVIFSQGLRNALSESLCAQNDSELLSDILLQHAGDPNAILAAIEDRFYQSDFQHVAGDLSVVVLTRSNSPDSFSLAVAEEMKAIEAELNNGEPDLLGALEDEIAALERMGFIRTDRNVIEPGAIEIDADQWLEREGYDSSLPDPAEQPPQRKTSPVEPASKDTPEESNPHEPAPKSSTKGKTSSTVSRPADAPDSETSGAPTKKAAKKATRAKKAAPEKLNDQVGDAPKRKTARPDTKKTKAKKPATSAKAATTTKAKPAKSRQSSPDTTANKAKSPKKSTKKSSGPAQAKQATSKKSTAKKKTTTSNKAAKKPKTTKAAQATPRSSTRKKTGSQPSAKLTKSGQTSVASERSAKASVKKTSSRKTTKKSASTGKPSTPASRKKAAKPRKQATPNSQSKPLSEAPANAGGKKSPTSRKKATKTTPTEQVKSRKSTSGSTKRRARKA